MMREGGRDLRRAFIAQMNGTAMWGELGNSGRRSVGEGEVL
jgi:hypothetical protein